MYLVDTSVWIDLLSEKKNKATETLNWILKNNIPHGINPLIFQEIIQGANDEKSLKKLSTYFETQTFYFTEEPIKNAEAAAKIYFNCRKKGITIRSTVDCLIAQTAIEHKLTLLHHDKDYERIKKITPRLKLAPN